MFRIRARHCSSMNAVWDARLSSPFPQRAMTLPAIWKGKTECRPVEHSAKESVSVTDEEALVRLKAQDRDALALLFDRYSRLILTIGFRVLRDYGEAEELVQNVFLYLYQKADLFQPDKGTAKSWITKAAYNRALHRGDSLVSRKFYFGKE